MGETPSFILEQLEKVKDSAGKTACDDWVEWIVDGKIRPFEVLVAMIMTAKSRDDKVKIAVENLRAAGLLEPSKLAASNCDIGASCISIRSMQNMKADYVIAAAKK